MEKNPFSFYYASKLNAIENYMQCFFIPIFNFILLNKIKDFQIFRLSLKNLYFYALRANYFSFLSRGKNTLSLP